jgi:SAM-dependent methyltransferase
MGAEQPAAYYDHAFGASRHYALSADLAPWAPLWQWTAARVRELGARRVLDVGCGPGHLAELLTRQRVEVVGVDFSDVAIRQARERVPGATFVHGLLPDVLDHLRLGWFDAVVCCEVLEHIECDLQVLTAVRELPVICTLPTFDDAGHVRHFPDAHSVWARYGAIPFPIGTRHWGLVIDDHGALHDRAQRSARDPQVP